MLFSIATPMLWVLAITPLSIFLAILVSVIAFWATNLENQVILLAYHHHPQYSLKAISIGYIGATGILLSISYGLSQPASIMPDNFIHYLGFLPIVLGMWELLKLFLKRKNLSSNLSATAMKSGAFYGVMTVAAATVASGGDSLVVFLSLFADTRYSHDLIILITAISMAGLAVVLSKFLSMRTWLSRQFQRFGDMLLPVLLMLVGIFILMDTPVDLD